MSISDFNYFLGLASLATQIIAAGFLVVFLFRTKVRVFNDVATQVGNVGLWSALFVTLAAAGINTYYSDFLGVEACYWCWWQRIFLYPQVILFTMALWREKYRATAIDVSLVMSIIGAGIAVYHHALQMLPGSDLPCPAVGVSCAQRNLFELGYITYPLMALSLFAFLIVVLLIVRSKR